MTGVRAGMGGVVANGSISDLVINSEVRNVAGSGHILPIWVERWRLGGNQAGIIGTKKKTRRDKELLPMQIGMCVALSSA